jgi:amidophosphoribosyltransferase
MCGIIAVQGHPEAANLAYLGLYALQHRGQESTGIVSSDGLDLYTEIGMGRVGDFFTQEKLSGLCGRSAIGHNRYSTAGGSSLQNAQPIRVSCRAGAIAIAHNGNLVNATQLRADLEEKGAIFRTTTDTEVILHLIAHSHKHDFANAVLGALRQVQGAYSLVIINEREIIAARDPYGFRPLCIGRKNGGYVVASETCALDLMDAEYIGEVCPGEIVLFSEGKEPVSFVIFPRSDLGEEFTERRCIFEYIYFSRPDSMVFSTRNIKEVQIAFGKQLAMEAPADADVVIDVPDSGRQAARGYAEQSGIPYDDGFVRGHYADRTFIEPDQEIRHFGVKVKLNPIRSVLQGRRVVVVDDSIVRGTTSKKLVAMIRRAGAREVHMRISSPMITGPCLYGIDTPTHEELIAYKCGGSVECIRDSIGTDSLAYLSHSGMLAAVGKFDGRQTYCDACFTGKYPVTADKNSMRELTKMTF